METFKNILEQVRKEALHFSGKKDKDDRPWFNGRDLRHIHCVRPAKCEKLKHGFCFGSKLPYMLTSLDLTDSFNQDESRERLYNYEALRNIPKCWAVIQVRKLFFFLVKLLLLLFCLVKLLLLLLL